MLCKEILITGAAGFIGYHTAKRLCEEGFCVIGIDNLNDYYDVRLKQWRLDDLNKTCNGFEFAKIDIENRNELENVFSKHKFDAVINLAARAGVRASIDNPQVYVTTNVLGTVNLLEMCKKYDVKKFVLASTSSLYAGKEIPFVEDMQTMTPISPYAATKGAAEQVAHAYHYLCGIDVTVLRYFTVYGPAGRPDMSVFRFVKCALDGKDVELNGDGTQSRDFTYVEDIANGTIKGLSKVGYEIINLGGDSPHSINDMISILERSVGKKLKIVNKPFPKEDVKDTWACIDKAKTLLNWNPTIGLEEGLNMTLEWTRKNENLVRKIEI